MISVPASIVAPLMGAIGGRLSWSVHIEGLLIVGGCVRDPNHALV
jgi:hypothetical protein